MQIYHMVPSTKRLRILLLNHPPSPPPRTLPLLRQPGWLGLAFRRISLAVRCGKKFLFRGNNKTEVTSLKNWGSHRKSEPLATRLTIEPPVELKLKSGLLSTNQYVVFSRKTLKFRLTFKMFSNVGVTGS